MTSITNIKQKIFLQVCIFQLLVSTGLCVYFSNQEYIELPEIYDFIFDIDKLFHITAFFIYGLSLQVAFFAFSKKRNMVLNNKMLGLVVIIVGFVFALGDEIHQYFIPGRDADVFDLLVDYIGISLSLLLFSKIRNLIMTIFLKLQ